MNDIQTKIVRGAYMKSAPAGLFAKTHDLHGWASVEVQDMDGDIVDISGIDTAMPTPIPLVHHKTVHKPNDMVDGDLPHVGHVSEWVKTMHPELNVQALAFGADYLRDEVGELVVKAQDTKRRYDLGHLSSFSIGFRPLVPPQRITNGRFRFPKVKVFELSTCVVPSNPFAVVMKSLDLDDEEMKQLDAYLLLDLLKGQKAISRRLDEIAEHNSLSDHEDELHPVQGHEAQQKAIDLDAVLKAVREQFATTK